MARNSWHRRHSPGRRFGTCSHARIPLKIAPEAFFGVSNAVVIHVSPGGIERLSQLLWNYLATDEEGAPRGIGAGLYSESIFHASTGTYILSRTYNTWTAEALQVTGLPVSATGVDFAAQVLDQVPPLWREHGSIPSGRQIHCRTGP
jgi:hypothetical protein